MISSLLMELNNMEMGNAIDTVKEAADVVIGSNDEDGIAKYLEQRNTQ